jgi:PGF-CTERM protein/surface glycoprotein (TIGR04207 family)
MTNETNKMRSLLMAALMVTSVVAVSAAFAGTAAAGVATADRTISASEVSPGGQATVTTTVNMDDEGGALTISEQFSPEVQSASIQSVTVDGEDASTVVEAADSTGAVVTLQSVSANAEVVVTYTVTTENAAGASYDITGTATSEGTEVAIGTTTLQTSADDGDDGDDGDNGDQPAPEPTVPDEADAVLSDGLRVWSGQMVYDDGYAADDQGLELQREVGDNDYQFVTQITVDENGTFLLDTSQYSTDTYRVVDTQAEDGDTTQETVNFEISTQTYSANADPATVQNAGDTTTDIVVDSNRNGYTHVLSSEDVDAETIQALIGGAGTLQDVNADGEMELLIEGGTTQDVVTADFEGVGAGNYTIDFMVLDTGVSASTTVTVTEAEAGDASFVTKAISEERGDVVSINVSVSGTAQSATVQVGGTSVNYNEVVTVTDENGDGYVEFYWNTYLAGTGSSGTFTTADDDTVTRQSGTSSFAEGRLAGGEYPVNASIGETETDIATVVLNDPTDVENAIQTWTAPDRKSSLNSESEDFVFNHITVDSTIAEGDAIVFETTTAGIFGQLAAPPAATTSGSLSAVEGLNFTITETEDSVDVNADPLTVDTSESLAILSGNTAFIYVDTNAYSNLTADTEFEATLAYEDSAVYRDETSTSVTFDVVEATAAIDAPEEGRLTVEQSTEGEVSGSSSLAAGTELTLTARSQGGQNPFLRTATATVQDDGTWTANLDVSDIPTGTNFTVSVKKGSTALADPVDATVGGAANLQLASLDAPETATPGQTITVTATVENTGDSSGTQAVSFVFADETVATQNVTVDAGSTQDVTFEAAVPSETGDYTHGVQVGDNAIVTAGITVEEEQTTTEPTTTEPTTTEPTTTEPTTTEPTTTEPTTTEMPETETTADDSGGQPGFGVAVALVALLAAALLATRRDE